MSTQHNPQDQQYATDSLLGKNSGFQQRYSPDILHPIARSAYRQTIAQMNAQVSRGVDIWNCYELSWLNSRGKPEVRIGQLSVPADSPFIVESKSLKLYFNSLNQCVFADDAAFCQRVIVDLSDKTEAAVQFELSSVDMPCADQQRPASEPDWFAEAVCLDSLAVDCEKYQRDASLLVTQVEQVNDETLYSHLLRSNCPVTGQPDWASIVIRYSGVKLDRGQLLKYLVSFRQHNGFHEQCIEQIFSDLLNVRGVEALTVCANYTRRGGLDINPQRSTSAGHNLAIRTRRQ